MLLKRNEKKKHYWHTQAKATRLRKEKEEVKSKQEIIQPKCSNDKKDVLLSH